MKKLIMLAAAALITAAPASAATLIVEDGILTGATGVDVNGTLFDVEFVDSSCVLAFNGCDSVSDFAFNSLMTAAMAGQALRDQVFIDGPSGQFDSLPANTLGCEESYLCFTLIPYGLDGLGSFIAASVGNQSGNGIDSITGPGTNGTSYDYSTNSLGVFARFTPAVSGVPEPATWAMMLLGFGGIGYSMRRRRKSGAMAQLA